MDTPQYLTALDALVRRDTSPTGFAGIISIGIESPEREWWWTVQLGHPPSTAFSRCPSPVADAILLMDETSSRRMLRGQSGGANRARCLGDRLLLRRLFTRYGTYADPVSIRLGGAA